MLSLFLSPFVVINIMASFVSLNVVESETFQNKRNQKVGMAWGFLKKNMKADVEKQKKKKKVGQTFIPF